MIKFRNNSLWLLGDTHEYKSTNSLVCTKRDCDIVFLGDGGEGFGRPEYDAIQLQKINNDCKSRNINLYCIRGNHTNPEVWTRGYEFSNLFLVPDYTEAEFPNGKTALLVGGGLSIDRYYRKIGIDYWGAEITEYKKIGKKFDYLFHDCPDFFNHSTESLKASPFAPLLLIDRTLFDDALAQRKVLSQIVEDIKCKEIYHGHMHNSIKEVKFGIKCQCLNIDEFFLLIN